MSSPGAAGGDGAARGDAASISRRMPTWPRVAVVVALFVLALIVSRACQQSEIDLTQEEAVTMATEQVDFAPEDTQVRLLRQGIDRHPFWIVSLSTPEPGAESGIGPFQDLAVVRIDATTGEIVEFREQKDEPKAQAKNREP